MTRYEAYASVDEADRATRLLRAAFDSHGLFFPSLHVEWTGNGSACIQLGPCTADTARALAALLQGAAAADEPRATEQLSSRPGRT